MNILLINNCHYRRGGSETVYFNTYEMLKHHGHNVHFFSLSDSRNIPCEDAVYFPKRGEDLSLLKRIVFYFYNFEAEKKIESFLSEHQIDIAHIHLIWGGLSPSILRALHRHHIPIIHTAHDYRLLCPAYTFQDGSGKICEACHSRGPFQCFFHKCCKNSFVKSLLMASEFCFRNTFFNHCSYFSGYIFVSRFSYEKHLSFIPSLNKKKKISLYNFLANGTYSVSDSFHLPDDDKRYYLYCGRLSKEKGLLTLLKAFEHFPNIRLLVAGTGPYEKQLVSYVNINAIQKVDFLGYKTGKDLQKLIGNAYFTVIPSEWYENNPMSVIESFAVGTPVIGARIGGIPELVTENTGLTFAPFSVDDLCAQIRKADNLPPNEYALLRKKCIQFFKDTFTEDQNYDKLISFYEVVIQSYSAEE